jgi:hypothetical protein
MSHKFCLLVEGRSSASSLGSRPKPVRAALRIAHDAIEAKQSPNILVACAAHGAIMVASA